MINQMSLPAAQEPFALNQYIMRHIIDSHEWHLPFGSVPLPSFLSVHALMLMFCAAFLILLFTIGYRKNDRVPSGLTNLLEVFVVFIRDQIVNPFLGQEDGKKMLPLFCTFFFFILTLNLMGLVPVFVTATSNINLTAALAFITFCFMIFGGIYKNGLAGFFKSFVPPGVPAPVLVILVPIEFLGLFIKPFALMLRLFANMLSGHIIIFAFLGLVVLFGIYALPAIAVALFVSVLELGIAFLQAYIFTLLSALYLGQLYYPEH